MLTIDGSLGEGGGQILRSSLALSLVTGTPFRMINIRAKRKRPGLMRQHLTAVQAATAISSGELTGGNVGSVELTFRPGKVRAGDYKFSIGTAGSTTLVLQSVLPALALTAGRSSLTLEGGTHNPLSPPFDFLAKAFLPVMNRMEPRVEAVLEQSGFYPAGGGRLRVTIDPAAKLKRIDLLERGEIRSKRVTAIVAALPKAIADREVQTIAKKLDWEPSCFHVETARHAQGPGNVVTVEIESEYVTEVFTGFGEKGVPAEKVADDVADEALEYLRVGVPVGKHLADQLLLPMALAGGGSFRTLNPSGHTNTQIEVLQQFLGIEIRKLEVGNGVWQFDVGGQG
jgi:RNA 3'-terminal phosphate cyclase (ATP)